MFRPARQCSLTRPGTQLTFLALLAGILFLFLLIFSPALHRISSASSSLDPCHSSQECYNLLLKQAQQEHNPYTHEHQLDMDDSKRHLSPEIDALKQQSPLSPPSSAANSERVKGAFVVLVRNSELYAMKSSMQYLEDRFNHKYNYPWIFLNEEPFTDEFIQLTKIMTGAATHYGLVPKEHWSYPTWINQTYAEECRMNMAADGVVYGGSESYRHMCRYQSGFFFLHPLLDDLEYYWRVEPGVKFSCDIDYDPFKLMKDRDLKYGFTLALEELSATVPTLWKTTVEFAKSHPQFIYPRTRSDSLFPFVTQDNGLTYNMCHFWSNFEIASMEFVRSEGYRAYFNHLDKQGGFFYERWGDAPVHSIAASLMLRRKDVHWFYDIGYKHDDFEHCPTEPHWLTYGKCYCDPGASFDHKSGSCTGRFLEVTNKTVYDFIVNEPDGVDL